MTKIILLPEKENKDAIDIALAIALAAEKKGMTSYFPELHGKTAIKQDTLMEENHNLISISAEHIKEGYAGISITYNGETYPNFAEVAKEKFNKVTNYLFQEKKHKEKGIKLHCKFVEIDSYSNDFKATIAHTLLSLLKSPEPIKSVQK